MESLQFSSIHFSLIFKRPPPILDEFGRVIAEAPPDEFQPRVGIAYALKEISPDLSSDDVESLFSLYVPTAFCDPHPEVSQNYF